MFDGQWFPKQGFQFIGRGGPLSGTPVSSISYITYARSESTSSSNDIVVPTVQDGDIGVWYSCGSGSGGGSIPSPSGWTTIASGTTTNLAAAMWTRILSASLSGATLTGVSGSGSQIANSNILMIFRGDVPANAITPSTWNMEVTTGNPASQSILASGGTPPLIVIAAGANNDQSDMGNLTVPSGPAYTTVLNSNNTNWFMQTRHRIYNSSPANHTIDMGDVGQQALSSGWLSIS